MAEWELSERHPPSTLTTRQGLMLEWESSIRKKKLRQKLVMPDIFDVLRGFIEGFRKRRLNH